MSYFAFVSNSGEWARSYVIPSVALSLACVVLLVWHFIEPERQIDAWTVTLLIVGFLPWLKTVFDTIAFPGGASIKYRQLQAEVERHQDEIDALNFLVASFLTPDQKRVLRKFAEDGPYEWAEEERRPESLAAIGGLVGKGSPGLLEQKPRKAGEVLPVIFPDDGSGDMKLLYGITERGRRFLKHLDRADNFGV